MLWPWALAACQSFCHIWETADVGSSSSHFPESPSSTSAEENGSLLLVLLVAADWEELSCSAYKIFLFSSECLCVYVCRQVKNLSANVYCSYFALNQIAVWIDTANWYMLCKLCKRKKRTAPRRLYLRLAIFVSLLCSILLQMMLCGWNTRAF